MPLSEAELLEAVRAGDREALAALVERHAPAVYRFAAKMCRQAEDAEDVLQETLLSAARHLGDFRGDAQLTTWLYAVARSFCIKRRRTSKFAPGELVSLEHSPEASALASGERSPEQAASERETALELDRAIAELEPEQREVLWLRDVEGLSAQEVSTVVDASVAAVKSRLHRARVALRAKLAREPAAPPPSAPGACPDAAELFSRHLEGEIGTEACRAMEEHLARCAHCRAACESLKHTLRLCRDSRVGVVPSPIQAKVRRALGALTGPDPRASR